MSEWIEEQEEEKVPFTVDNDEKAEWCMERRREHLQEIEKWTTHYEAEKRRVCMVHENAVIRLESELKGYLFDRDNKGLTRETKTQTVYNLPSGKIFMKHQTPEFVRDDAVIIEWLREHAPQFIKVKEEVDWAGMKDAFGFSKVEEETVDEETGEITKSAETRMVMVDDETGEIFKVPGVSVRTREDVFKVDDKEVKKNV